MGKFSGVLICTDVDGTLLNDGHVSEKNAKAIKYFQDNGGYFTVCTGRPVVFLEKFLLEIVPNAPVIMMNGALIYDHVAEKAVFEAPMNDDDLHFADDVARKYPEVIKGYVFSNERSMGLKGGNYYNTVKENGAFVPYKLIFYVSAEDSDRMLAEIGALTAGKYNTARSWINGIEIQSLEVDKGIAARKLAEILGDVELVVGVGDYENDIPLLQKADIGYAVENALDSVKAAADRITVSYKEDAIAAVIADIEKNYLKKG